jgi:hypothetical protein
MNGAQPSSRFQAAPQQRVIGHTTAAEGERRRGPAIGLPQVAGWAWPFLEAHLVSVLTGERVFRGVDRWVACDREKWPRVVANLVATPKASAEKPHEEAPATDWAAEASDDSRGGTRTRDPGIMSADDPPEKPHPPREEAP